MMKQLLGAIIIFFVFATLSGSVNSATAKKKSASVGVGVVVQKIKGGKGINVTFSNLKTVRAVSYILSYTTNGQAEGAVGSIKPGKSKSVKRQLLYGTCSSGVCRYHQNVKNAVLEVTSTLKNGRQTTRTYKIR